MRKSQAVRQDDHMYKLLFIFNNGVHHYLDWISFLDSWISWISDDKASTAWISADEGWISADEFWISSRVSEDSISLIADEKKTLSGVC